MKGFIRLIPMLIILVIVGSCGNNKKENLLEITGDDGLISAEYYQVKDSVIRFTHLQEMAGRGTVMVHQGILGVPGSRYEIFDENRDQLLTKVNDLIEKIKAEQYLIYPPEAYSQLIIQIDSSEWGDTENLEKFVLIEDLLNRALSETGNGKVTGSDIGQRVSYFVIVFHPKTATSSILEELQSEGYDFNIIIAIEQGNDVKVLWPKNFQGEFSLI